MKLRREASILKGKALSSLRRALAAFNSYEDDGRATEVLLKLQHAFEMLLKAGLVQEQVGVFDKQLSQSIGFEKCVNLARQHLGLTADEAGTLRAIDALRDEAQHWYNEVSEGLLYSHARASVTLFDDLLQRAFGESLVSHLPHRVLPISSEPPKDIQLLIDEEFTQIAELLKPGRRRRPEACARIRTLLAMEAHVAENVRVSKRDVDRVQKGIRAGRSLPEVFPRLSDVGTEITGEGIHVAVRFVRNATEAVLPVRFVGADDPGDAAAIREVDLQKRFPWTAKSLATKLELTTAKTRALRWKLGIDNDPSCTHDFVFGSQRHRMFSDNAYSRLRDALPTTDLTELWQEYRHRNRAA
jgi:phosphoglycolate phosphatase-like HAD superfamily hydrolase